MGSTNGAAVGKNVKDATRQALLEVIERDAFWYYARTRTFVQGLPVNCLPKDIINAVATYPQFNFFFSLLPTPFNIPIVQVTIQNNSASGSKLARGTGATSRLDSSIRRAFAECLQMYHSLSCGEAVEPTPNDMRNFWYTGEAKEIFPQFFDSPTIHLSVTEFAWGGEALITHILQSAAEQNLQVYRHILIEAPGFAVVKVIMSKISVTDAYGFKNNDRFSQFAKLMQHSEPFVTYHGSLFM